MLSIVFEVCEATVSVICCQIESYKEVGADDWLGYVCGHAFSHEPLLGTIFPLNAKLDTTPTSRCWTLS